MKYENVKVGDVMRVLAAGPTTQWMRETVIKVTKTMIVTDNAKYNKRTGIEVGHEADRLPPRLGGIARERKGTQ